MEPFIARPRAPRIVAAVAGLALIVMFIAIAVAFPSDIANQFTFAQVATLILLLTATLALLNAVGRSRVKAEDSGLTVVNGYRAHRLAWDEIEAIGYREGAPWPVVLKKDGDSISILALQSSDGEQTWKAVGRLRAFLG